MQEDPSARPNIIIICSDQHRADTIGAYGSRVCRTPNLDRLPNAARVVLFESYSGGPEDRTPPPLMWAKTIRSARWRATFFPLGSPGELYDLENDPQELRNLWFDPSYWGVLQLHRAMLLERLVMADYPLPPRTYAV